MKRYLPALALLAFAAFTHAEDKKTEDKKADDVKVAVGQPAPNFELEAATKDGTKKISLKDLKGKNVVLFFYPKALTGG
jgi:peroxiredoxin Q/BCP